jgi:hypothetical protein
VTGSCEHDNETSGSMRCEGILDLLSDYQLLNKDVVS